MTSECRVQGEPECARADALEIQAGEASSALRGHSCPELGTMGQDMFGGSLGSVLEAFYEKFMPPDVAGELARIINRDRTRINEAWVFLVERHGFEGGGDRRYCPKDEKTGSI